MKFRFLAYFSLLIYPSLFYGSYLFEFSNIQKNTFTFDFNMSYFDLDVDKILSETSSSSYSPAYIDTNFAFNTDITFSITDKLSTELHMPLYIKDARDEFIPLNPWIGLNYFFNDKLIFKLHAELAFIRDNLVNTIILPQPYSGDEDDAIVLNKAYRFYPAVLFNYKLNNSFTFFTELSTPISSKIIYEYDEEFALAVSLKPGLDFMFLANKFKTQLNSDIQQLVIPESETYFGAGFNLTFMPSDIFHFFLASSFSLDGYKWIKENNYLVQGYDEFAFNILLGFTFNYL